MAEPPTIDVQAGDFAGEAPKHYLLRLPEDMAAQVDSRRTARAETWAVWIREAIRQRLERENP